MMNFQKWHAMQAISIFKSPVGLRTFFLTALFLIVPMASHAAAEIDVARGVLDVAVAAGVTQHAATHQGDDIKIASPELTAGQQGLKGC